MIPFFSKRLLSLGIAAVAATTVAVVLFPFEIIIKSDKSNDDAEKENTCFVVAGKSSMGGVLCFSVVFSLLFLLLVGCCLLHCTISISMCTSVARFDVN